MDKSRHRIRLTKKLTDSRRKRALSGKEPMKSHKGDDRKSLGGCSALCDYFEGEAEGIDPDQILEDLLSRIPTQPPKSALLPQGL